MLVAYGPEGYPIIAEETALEQLQRWSCERALYCPNCRGVVHVRGGPEKRTHLHFAHQRGECAWSTEAESIRHARGKMLLAQWLAGQYPQAVVTLEQRLPEPNRIADIFVTHMAGERWAIEFQCAPLDVKEWRMRHSAYHSAGIVDIWVIGSNRREKQEAFIEAILAAAHEVLFLDALVMPPRIWLRWPVSRETIRSWQSGNARLPALDAWVGGLGQGASLSGQLQQLRIDPQGKLMHPARLALEAGTQLLATMNGAVAVDESTLCRYLRQQMDEAAIHVVLLPLLRAYIRDPQLLRRYNYGRGHEGQPVLQEDAFRVRKARYWLRELAQKGFPASRVQALARDVPFVGPYAAFVSYIEMLLAME